jgi:DNA-binding MarR family transcriptional regulator
MGSKLAKEIKQTRPFRSVQQQVLLNVMRTADAFTSRVSELLKPYGLSPTQYNVLRILRGAAEGGLACGEVGERMVTRDPDVTRLLDRLEKRGLIVRSRQTSDRRVVKARITAEGLELLKELDTPVHRFDDKLLGHMSQADLKRLDELLEEARDVPG